jgi:hypothetical protein
MVGLYAGCRQSERLMRLRTPPLEVCFTPPNHLCFEHGAMRNIDGLKEEIVGWVEVGIPKHGVVTVQPKMHIGDGLGQLEKFLHLSESQWV